MLSLCGSFAGAVQYASFKPADIHGVTVTSSPDGLTYQIALDLNPYMVVDGKNYSITGLAGFYALNGSDDASLNASGINVLTGGKPAWVWNTTSESGGETAGWEARSNANRLTVGSSFTFKYIALNGAAVEGFGYHLVFSPTIDGANTGFYRQDAAVPPVPEPVSASLIGLGVGFAGLIRRRRKR